MKGRIELTAYMAENEHSKGWTFPVYEVSHIENSWFSFKFNVETQKLIGGKVLYLYSHVEHLAYL